MNGYRDLESKRLKKFPQSTFKGKGNCVPDATSDGCRPGAEEIAEGDVDIDVCHGTEAAEARPTEEEAKAAGSLEQVAYED